MFMIAWFMLGVITPFLYVVLGLVAAKYLIGGD